MQMSLQKKKKKAFLQNEWMFPNFMAFHLIVFPPKDNLICICYMLSF